MQQLQSTLSKPLHLLSIAVAAVVLCYVRFDETYVAGQRNLDE